MGLFVFILIAICFVLGPVALSKSKPVIRESRCYDFDSEHIGLTSFHEYQCGTDGENAVFLQTFDSSTVDN